MARALEPQAVRQQPPVSRQQAQAELVKRLLTAVSVSSPMQVMWVARQQLVAQRHVRAQVRQLGHWHRSFREIFQLYVRRYCPREIHSSVLEMFLGLARDVRSFFLQIFGRHASRCVE